MGPSKKSSTKGKGALAAVSKVRTLRILVATTAEEGSAAAGSSRTEALANEDGFPFHWFQSEATFLRSLQVMSNQTPFGAPDCSTKTAWMNLKHLPSVVMWSVLLGDELSTEVIRHTPLGCVNKRRNNSPLSLGLNHSCEPMSLLSLITKHQVLMRLDKLDTYRSITIVRGTCNDPKIRISILNMKKKMKQEI
ncbi:hypothetical protein Fot_02537 [Forsythia ovata]|uniref:Uncharacterized protein n=1 Tax=Forsythia ovata TaxID=205694 RepID=A0ABD1XA54_9LAMI